MLFWVELFLLLFWGGIAKCLTSSLEDSSTIYTKQVSCPAVFFLFHRISVEGAGAYDYI